MISEWIPHKMFLYSTTVSKYNKKIPVCKLAGTKNVLINS